MSIGGENAVIKGKSTAGKECHISGGPSGLKLPLLSLKSEPAQPRVSTSLKRESKQEETANNGEKSGIETSDETESIQLPTTNLTKSFVIVLLSSFQNSYRSRIKIENEKFHRLFKTIQNDDRLIIHYDCVLNRGDHMIESHSVYPYIGELFLSQNHLCFATKNPQIGWLFTRLQISYKQIINITMANNVDNGIIIETNLGKVQLSGFSSSKLVYDMLTLMWKRNTVSEKESGTDCADSNSIMSCHNNIQTIGQTLSFANEIQLYKLIRDTMQDNYSVPMDNESRLRDIITSIDADNARGVSPKVEDGQGNIFDHNDVESEYEEHDLTERVETVTVYSLKNKIDKAFAFEGLLFNDQFQDDRINIPDKIAKKETVILEEEYQVSPGLLFELLFSEHDTSFQTDILKEENSTEITSFGPFDRKTHSRSYSYVMKLNNPIGPKTTLCQVTEELVNYKPLDLIELISTTRTPNIPSGGAFSVKTRHIILWASPTTCKLKLSYWVEWTGSTWIKNIIDSSCEKGVMDSLKIFKKLIVEYLGQYVEAGTIEVNDQNPSDMEDEGKEEAKEDTAASIRQPIEQGVEDAISEKTKVICTGGDVDRVKKRAAFPTFGPWITIAIIMLLLLNLVALLAIITQLRTLNMPRLGRDLLPEILVQTPIRDTGADSYQR